MSGRAIAHFGQIGDRAGTKALAIARAETQGTGREDLKNRRWCAWCCQDGPGKGGRVVNGMFKCARHFKAA